MTGLDAKVRSNLILSVYATDSFTIFPSAFLMCCINHTRLSTLLILPNSTRQVQSRRYSWRFEEAYRGSNWY